MSLKDWLESDEAGLREERVPIRGKDFLVVEIDLAERSRLLADAAANGGLSNDKAEGVLMARCICDPETKEPLIDTKHWEKWKAKGSSFSPLLERVLVLNGFKNDEAEEALKNSDTTGS